MSGKETYFTLEYPCHSPDQERWFIGRVTAFPEGECKRAVVAHEDITERKKSERKLAQLNDERAMLLDTMDAQVWYLADCNTYSAVNRAHANFIGMKQDDVKNQKLEDLFAPSVAAECRQHNREAYTRKEPVHSQEWVQRADGEERLLAITKTPKIGADGNVEYLVCVAHDITESEQTREALATSEQRYRGLSESQRDLIVRVGLDGAFTYVNDAY